MWGQQSIADICSSWSRGNRISVRLGYSAGPFPPSQRSSANKTCTHIDSLSCIISISHTLIYASIITGIGAILCYPYSLMFIISLKFNLMWCLALGQCPIILHFYWKKKISWKEEIQQLIFTWFCLSVLISIILSKWDLLKPQCLWLLYWRTIIHGSIFSFFYQQWRFLTHHDFATLYKMILISSLVF